MFRTAWHRFFRHSFIWLVGCAGLMWLASFAAAAEEERWVELSGGRNLDGWRKGTGEWMTAGKVSLDPADNGRFKIEPGSGVLVNGRQGKAPNLMSQREFGDAEIHVEFVVPKASNSGVYVQGRYEIQILDSFAVEHPNYGDCGGIYQRWKDEMGYEGHAPAVNASRAPGEWQSFDILFRAPRFDESGKKIANARFIRVIHNGALVHTDVDVTGPTRGPAYEDEAPQGPLMIQGDHGPVALRNVRVRPLDHPAREPNRLPGVSREGTVVLPNQWSLKPAGRQVKLGDFPVQVVLHPRQPWAAVLQAGYGEHEIIVVDLKQERVVSRVRLPQAFYGLCFDPEGKRLFASGAEYEVVHQFAFDDGYLSAHRELPVGKPNEKFVPAGITCDAGGERLYVACPWGNTLCVLPLAEPQQAKHVAMGDDSYPYASLASADGKRLFVSLWGAASMAVLNLESLEIEGRWATEGHPTELALSPDGERLFVACANTNVVTVLATATGEAKETISSSLHPQAPPGSTPNSLALSSDGKVLFIANADNNDVAVFDVSEPGESRSLGFLPVGWYPTSVRYSASDKRIYVANGKGLMSQANPQGPHPLQSEAPAGVRQYIGGLLRGTLSAIDSPSPEQMAEYTRTALACSPLRADRAPTLEPSGPNHPIPAQVGGASPIKHCLYIIKENRTYDQVFGDIAEGNGDVKLCLFPEAVTPNHHALVRQFVLLDNFYVESEVSADGHEWSMAAYASDFVEKTWPLVYRGGKEKLKYPSEGAFEIAFPGGGYIWDRCREAGVSYRSYGEFIDNGPEAAGVKKARLPALEGHYDPQFHGWDMDYPDVKRAERFIVELKQYEKQGEWPQFMVLRLPNDHTAGMSRGKPTPTAMVADNDLALGIVVEAVSRSKFWPETAIFVVEDDAQNGSDHVDAHRTVALVVSPYTKRGYVDSTMYSTASMLRTMELILGLEPMSQFDAAAQPMYASFRAEPDLSPYKHRPAGVDLAARNPEAGWGAELSALLNFSREDAADDLVLNQIVWKSVRGLASRMPPPVRAPFVFPLADDDD